MKTNPPNLFKIIGGSFLVIVTIWILAPDLLNMSAGIARIALILFITVGSALGISLLRKYLSSSKIISRITKKSSTKDCND